MRHYLGILLAATLTACATPGMPDAPHRSTEAMLTGTPGVVSLALVDAMTERQYALVERSAHFLVFERPIDNAAYWQALGGSPALLPRARVAMALAPVGATTHVTADLLILAEPGSAGEHLADAASLDLDPRLGLVLSEAEAALSRIPNATLTRLAEGGRESALR